MCNRNNAGGLGTLLTAVAILVCGTTATVVQAQGVFKTVGPDGTVTYSDAPPAGAGGQASTVDVTPAEGSGNASQLRGMSTQGAVVASPRRAIRHAAMASQADQASGAPSERPTAASAATLNPAPVHQVAAPPPSRLNAVTLELVRGALSGMALTVMPDPFSSMDVEASAPCADSRQFVVFRQPATADGGDKAKSQTASSNNLSVALCRGGPLGPDTYAALFAASQEYLRQAVQTAPAYAQFGQRRVNIGGREALIGPLAAMGHGVTITPVGVLQARIAGFTLVVVIDDATAHIGEAGHLTMKEALDQLESVLRAADAVIAP